MCKELGCKQLILPALQMVLLTPLLNALPSISLLMISHNVLVDSHPGFFQTSCLVMQVDEAQLALAVCTWSATSAAGAAEPHMEQLLPLCASWSRVLDQLVPTKWCHFTWLFRDWWGTDGSGGQTAPG